MFTMLLPLVIFGATWFAQGASETTFCDAAVCLNGGTCLRVTAHPFFKCVCSPRYTGIWCDTDHPFSVCNGDVCLNGGTCLDQEFHPYFKCACAPLYQGLWCGTRMWSLVAECDAGVGRINDLHEDTADSVLVAGHGGLARCQLTGGQGQVIQGPWETSPVLSAVVTDDGVMWVASWNSSELKSYLYRQNNVGSWQKVLDNDRRIMHRLEVDINGHVLGLDAYADQVIYDIQPSPQPTIVSILNLTHVARWMSIHDFAVLPSGSVVVTDIRGNDAHIVGRNGTLEATLGDSESFWLGDPQAVTLDTKGNILIADRKPGKGIAVFSSTGEPLTSIHQKELDVTKEILVTSSGLLVVGKSKKVQIFKKYK